MVVHDEATTAFNNIANKVRGLDKDTQNLTNTNKSHTSSMKDAERAGDDLEQQWLDLSGATKDVDRDTKNLTQSQKNQETQTKKSAAATDLFSASLRDLKIAIIGIAIAPLLAGLTELVALLIAVGDAAGVAVAALGGALVSAIATAAPVVGLLVLAFKQLVDVIKLSTQETKTHNDMLVQASQRSLQHTQQLYAEEQAHQAVTDATKNLVIARRDALRQIQDLNNAEKEAILTSQRATLGLISSQAALAGLVDQGGSALDIANAQDDLTQSQQSVPYTKVLQGRATQDAARARRQGVSGNPQVVSAQRQLVQAQQQVILQQKEATQANKDANAELNAQNLAISKLTPAEKGLLSAVTALRLEWKNNWKGITDPIINSFTGVVRKITDTLKDPQIHAAFLSLSGVVGKSITTATSFFFTPQAKKDFLELIGDAKQNLPLISRILSDIFQIFGKIAVAAAPLVHDILKGILSFFDNFNKATSNKKGLSDFFTEGMVALKAFGSIISGIFGILVTLGKDGGVTAGVTILQMLGTGLQNLSGALSSNPQGVQAFFEKVTGSAKLLGGLIHDILFDLIKLANTGAFEGLVKILKYDVLPVLSFILDALGKFLHWFGDVSQKYPVVGKMAIIFAGLVITIAKIFPLLKLLIPELAETGAVADLAFGPAGLIILGILALIAAIVLLNDKFHFLEPTFKFLQKIFSDVIAYIEKNWKGLLVLLTGPLGLVVVTIVNHFDAIRAAAVDLKNKMTPIFDFIVNNIVLPLWKIALKPILDGLNDIVHFFDDNDLVTIFGGVFSKIAGIVDKLVNGLGKAYGLLQKIASLGGILSAGGTSNTAAGVGAHNIGAGNNVDLGTTPGSPTSQDITAGVAAASGGGSKQKNQAGGGHGEGGMSPEDAKKLLTKVVALANSISGKYTYSYGGGHGTPLKPGGPDDGFDCSGAVSGILAAAGLIPGTTDTTGLAGELLSGPGDGDLVVWVKSTGDPETSHTFMDILGHRFEYGGYDNATGWSTRNDTTGFSEYHPKGFARGGMVPGPTDTVPAMLTPGEMILTKSHQMMLGGTNFLRKALGFSLGGPVSRGGEAVSTTPTGPAVPNIIAGVSTSIWGSLYALADGFKVALGSSSPGYIKMVSAFTALSQVFTNQAQVLTRLVSTQKTALVSGRYKVNGASGNTSVVDTGSDLTDAQKTVGQLGYDRDSILGQLNDTNSTSAQLQTELKKTPKADTDKRNLILGEIQTYKNQSQSLSDALTQNTLDLVAAQTQVIQDEVDKAQNAANTTINTNQVAVAIAQLTGIGKGSIPSLIQNQIDAMTSEQGPLQQALAQAQAEGNTALIQSIQGSLDDLNQSIAQATDDKFQAVIQNINDTANNALQSNSLQSRIAQLGGNALNSLRANTDVLQNKGTILQQQLAQTQAAYGAATTPAEQLQLQQAIGELQTQIAENTDALRDNTEQINQSVVDQINNTAGFNSGINSGVGGLIQSLASVTQQFDLPDQIKAYQNENQNLGTQGSGLRQQLQSQFGINLSSNPQQLIAQLTGTDFSAIEFGMDDQTKSTFEGLINSIISNATAVQDNTSALNQANGQLTEQNFTSSLWTNFRDALFTGTGQILNTNLMSSVPQAATGAQILSGGLLKVHPGETVTPAKVAKFGGSSPVVNIAIDNRGEGDVDTLSLTKRLAMELKTA